MSQPLPYRIVGRIVTAVAVLAAGDEARLAEFPVEKLRAWHARGLLKLVPSPADAAAENAALATPGHMHGRVMLDGQAMSGPEVQMIVDGLRLRVREALADVEEHGRVIDRLRAELAARGASAPSETPTADSSATVPPGAPSELLPSGATADEAAEDAQDIAAAERVLTSDEPTVPWDEVKGQVSEEQAVATPVPPHFPAAELLLANGFDTVEAIRAATDEALLAVDGIGPKRLGQIREAQHHAPSAG